MGRTAVADTGLWSYLQSLGQPNGFIVGLILGQVRDVCTSGISLMIQLMVSRHRFRPEEVIFFSYWQLSEPFIPQQIVFSIHNFSQRCRNLQALSSGNKDFIVHLARTPHYAPTKNIMEDETMAGISAESSESSESPLQPPVFSSVRDIKDSWVADHAKQVTRMLPGGMWVLGLFLVGPNDPFTDQSDCGRIHSILRTIRSTLQQNRNLYGDSPSSEKLLLHVSTKTNTISCRTADLNGSAHLKQAEWKFQKNPTQWHQIESTLLLEQVFQLSQGDLTQSLPHQMQVIQDAVFENVNKSVCTIDGEIRDSSEPLEALDKKRKSKSSAKKGGKASANEEGPKVMKANLYLPMMGQAVTNKSGTGIEHLECVGEMNSVGSIATRVFLHQKALVEEAVEALKQDMIRSLAARLEMHLDSVIEEEHGSPEERLTLHEPPRRVMLPLPYAPVTVSDLLFPGEGPVEALASSLELLDLDLNEFDVQKDTEVQADPAEVFGWDKQSDSEVLEEVKSGTCTKLNFLYIVLLVSVLILLISIAIQMSGIVA